VVRVTFVIDTCDREIIAWGATTGGFDGETVRDLMLLCVERRFGTHRTPHAMEWLTDNGSCYTARETVAFGQSLGLVPCFTPVRSPESNGMAEPFVKTFKRDYVYVHDRPDSATVLAQVDRWFDDYNESHPHKGLKMKSGVHPRTISRRVMFATSRDITERKQAEQRVRDAALHDTLTGLPNRTLVMDYCKRILAAAQRICLNDAATPLVTRWPQSSGMRMPSDQ